MMLVYRPSGLKAGHLLLSLLLLLTWETGTCQVHYSVPEEAKHGTFVGRIAQDLGLELAELVPRLFRVASKGRGDLLEVNLQNGILFVNSRIDREELCGRSADCSIHLEVIVERPLQVFHVEVEVKDINDNPPVFSVSEQKLSIPESRLLDSRFPLEGASDVDVGENAVLTYRLTPNEFFILDITNKKDKGKFPVLVLRKLLDREETPQFQLLLTATDGGKPELTGSVSLLILVLDANDNAPVFDRPIYEVKMYENSANQTLVIWLNASDADEEINKEMIYSFSSLVSPSIRRKFQINERTGEIRINDAIDFEDSNTYEIHVDVTDKGNPPMVGHCTVLVEIMDENDNSPEVVVTSLSLPVREDAQVGTVIALVSVSDRDSGANGQVTCSLTPHVPFKLVSRPLFCKSMSYAMFRSLKGGLSTKRLLLSLLLLAFWEAGSGQVHYSVPEEVKHGTFVGRIAQDLGLELAELVPRLFRVSSKGHGDLLEVNLQNGILFVNSRIDREELCGRSAECSIHLEVIVERPLQVFHVEVEVKDINDNPPVFSLREQKLLISESKQPDSHFPLEGASDADIGENALLTYRLSKNEYFSLELPANSKPTNRLSLALKKPLDREKTPEVSLLLTAVDRGKPELTGTVQLFIRVLDINDNDPEFEQSEYKVRLMENAAKETFVIKLNATDRDEGVNGEVTYSLMSIKPNGKSLFTIDENNGEVRVNGTLDYEENKFYEIEVRATDKGNPLMAGHCTVWVEILDANDNAPEITVTSLSLTVREDTQTSTVIALISVSDRDSGANGQVTCSLTPSVPFKITSTFKNYYSLVLDSALDRESVSVYELVVTAQDGGSPSLSATASVSADPPRQRLLVLVKDHGEPALLSTATVLLSLMDNGQAPKTPLRMSSGATGPEVALVDVNVYLIIAICAVSSLLVLTLLLYTALRCSAPPTQGVCGPGKPTLVCSSAVGSWSYSQQRRQRVCSGEGPPKVDLMAFSPSLPPGLDREDGGERQEAGSNHPEQCMRTT
nr:PREDICTED: protocadherin alpha-10-like [Rhinolophus sinicus]